MNIHDFPIHAIAAVTHNNPYPYYEELTSEKPFYYDNLLESWVVANGRFVDQILTDRLFKVRPMAEQTPKSIKNTLTHQILKDRIRMNDTAESQKIKKTFSTNMNSIGNKYITDLAYNCSETLYRQLNLDDSPNFLSTYIFQFPLIVITQLLGCEFDINEIEKWVVQHLASLQVGVAPKLVAQGNIASKNFQKLFNKIYDDKTIECNWIHKIITNSSDRGKIINNIIGLILQTYEATAALISTSVKVLQSNVISISELQSDQKLLLNYIREVCRFDAPVQNTWRYVHQDIQIGDFDLKAGDKIILLLAAANRDQEYNLNPHSFDVNRKVRNIFTFGMGNHACPGEEIATLICAVAVRKLMNNPIVMNLAKSNVTYLPSPNVRMPLFKGDSRIYTGGRPL